MGPGVSAWGKAWSTAWGAAWGALGEVLQVVTAADGGRRRRRKQPKPVRPIDTYRTPEDIQREQRDTERYLAELENRKVATPVVPKADVPEVAVPVVAQPILPDVAARAASAVQAKLEEAETAARAQSLARRRKALILLLALD